MRFLDAGKLRVEPAELVGKARVIDSQAVENRRVEITEVDRILDDVVAKIVGLAVFDPRLYAGARQPHGEAAAVMVAPHAGVAQAALAKHGATELGGEDHER